MTPRTLATIPLTGNYLPDVAKNATFQTPEALIATLLQSPSSSDPATIRPHV